MRGATFFRRRVLAGPGGKRRAPVLGGEDLATVLSHEPVIPRKKKDRGPERRNGQAPANVRVNLPGYVKYGLVINPGVTVPNGA